MPVFLEDRTVVVTGAGSGFGRACALRFLADGARVIGADIDIDGLERIAAEGVSTITADCARDGDMRAMVQKALDETGRIDVLFSNAGYSINRRVDQFGDGEFERMIAVHVFGALYAMRAAIPYMRTSRFGRIVATLSRGAEIATAGNSAYSAAKASLWALLRCAAEEVHGDGVLVNGLIPGPTNTLIWRRPRPELQPPDAVYPTVRMLATLDDDGPHGKMFFWEREYPLFLGTIPAGATLDYWDQREGRRTPQ